LVDVMSNRVLGDNRRPCSSTYSPQERGQVVKSLSDTAAQPEANRNFKSSAKL
jgi:hypothetical protein